MSRAWQPAEDAILRSCKAQHWSAGKIAELITKRLGVARTAAGVHGRLHYLGLVDADEEDEGKRDIWVPSQEDDDLITQAWLGDHGLTELRRRLEVTDTDLYRRAHELGLGRKIGHQMSTGARGGMTRGQSQPGRVRGATEEEFAAWLVTLYQGRTYG